MNAEGNGVGRDGRGGPKIIYWVTMGPSGVLVFGDFLAGGGGGGLWRGGLRLG